jgi:hypothetical protein
MITLIARTDPTTSCPTFLIDQECKVLSLHTNKNKTIPKKPPSIGIVVIWIAKLGGYLARKSDGRLVLLPCGEYGSALQILLKA